MSSRLLPAHSDTPPAHIGRTLQRNVYMVTSYNPGMKQSVHCNTIARPPARIIVRCRRWHMKGCGQFRATTVTAAARTKLGSWIDVVVVVGGLTWWRCVVCCHALERHRLHTRRQPPLRGRSPDGSFRNNRGTFEQREYRQRWQPVESCHTAHD